MMNKQKIALIVVISLLVLVLGGVIVWKNFSTLFDKKSSSTESKKKVSIEQVNVIPVNERPYLQLSPTGDGRNLIVLIKELKKPAETMEYLLEYQTGSLLQGVQGEIALTKIPAQTEQLLGSCSAGGKCTYHEDVAGGKIETTYRGEINNYKLRQEWRFITNSQKESTVASRDGKFQVTSQELAKQKFIIILNSPGYPQEPVGRIVSDPYSLAVSQTLSGTADVSIRSSEETEGLTIQGWNGTEWQSFDSTTTDKVVTAKNVPLLELYLVTTQ
jgi:hypothetical protein